MLLSDILAGEGEKTTRELQEKFGDDKVVFVECNVTNQQQIKGICPRFIKPYNPILI